ncbi:MAG: phosphodiester glycosidase family protein, partial [Bacteroidales bacterium]
AIEAGPMLLENGKVNIDMKGEGWKHVNSIKTQAARLDYTDMRGPKIAAGIDTKGNLVILAINGRIRESVGVTHAELAEILKKEGMIKAMGFDPGGSSTLFVEGKVRNISPYNHRYEQNVYSLPPEPRAVSSTILGYLNKD